MNENLHCLHWPGLQCCYCGFNFWVKLENRIPKEGHGPYYEYQPKVNKECYARLGQPMPEHLECEL